MSEIQICPWCQMEIVWDEETGPEEECPYCLNELKDYRTVTVHLDDEEETDRLSLEEIDQALEVLLPEQEEELDCEQCQERMIVAGTLRADGDRFQPFDRSGVPPLLQSPVDMTMLVCPSCFQVKTVLAGDSRQQLMHAIRGMGKLN